MTIKYKNKKTMNLSIGKAFTQISGNSIRLNLNQIFIRANMWRMNSILEYVLLSRDIIFTKLGMKVSFKSAEYFVV